MMMLLLRLSRCHMPPRLAATLALPLPLIDTLLPLMLMRRYEALR